MHLVACFSARSVKCKILTIGTPLITKFMGPTWGPSGADRTQMGPMLAPWSLLSGTPYPTREYEIWGSCCDIIYRSECLTHYRCSHDRISSWHRRHHSNNHTTYLAHDASYGVFVMSIERSRHGRYFPSPSSYCMRNRIYRTVPDNKFMGPTWGPAGSCRPQMGPIMAPWTLLLGVLARVSAAVTKNPMQSYLFIPLQETMRMSFTFSNTHVWYPRILFHK